MQLNTFLNFGGNCKEAFTFYSEHLGAKIIMLMTHSQNPTQPAAPGQQDAVMYARIEIGGTHLMASDVPAEHFQPMRSAYLSLTLSSPQEVERIHNILADGGQVFMPLQETFYATRFSMLRDKFGTNWMLLHQRPTPPTA